LPSAGENVNFMISIGQCNSATCHGWSANVWKKVAPLKKIPSFNLSFAIFKQNINTKTMTKYYFKIK
jgi:hypothetical protein